MEQAPDQTLPVPHATHTAHHQQISRLFADNAICDRAESEPRHLRLCHLTFLHNPHLPILCPVDSSSLSRLCCLVLHLSMITRAAPAHSLARRSCSKGSPGMPVAVKQKRMQAKVRCCSTWYPTTTQHTYGLTRPWLRQFIQLFASIHPNPSTAAAVNCKPNLSSCSISTAMYSATSQRTCANG